ncbi:MAG: type IV secretory system conjugative DNA transfer family protein [Pseudomonadota bacterium]
MPYAIFGIGALIAGSVLSLIAAVILQLVYGYSSPIPFFAIFLCVVSTTSLMAAATRRHWELLSWLFLGVCFLLFIGSSRIFGWDDFPDPSSAEKIITAIALYHLLPPLFFIAPIYLLSKLNAINESATYRKWFIFGRGGKARWAGLSTYNKLGTSGDLTVPTNGEGIFLGATLFQDTMVKSYVGFPKDDDSHMITVAQSGSGKSVTALWPTIRDYKGAMIVLDPKGEHTEFCRGGHGTQFVLDPFSKVAGGNSIESVNYNPLAEIDVNSDHARAYLNAISSACVFEEKGDNAHFSESAKTIIEGVIVHVLTSFGKERQTLPQVADMFRGYDPEIGASDPKAFDEVITEMTTNKAAGGVAMDAAGLLLSAGDRERGSMLTTCFRSLKWTTDPAMRRHLEGGVGERSENLIRSLVRSQDERLFVVLPFEYIEESAQTRWMRTVVNLINVHLFQNPRDRSQAKLLFVFDEFHKLGYMEQIEEGIVTARGAGAKYWILIQNIGQLKELYKRNWETFIGSSNVQVFGVQSPETANWTAAAIGGDRDSSSGQYPLLRPDEVLRFLGKEDATQIVIPTTGLPMRLERVAYKRTKKYRGIW